ncbi:MAG: Gfo/Idh/MocA family oxidoreductase [Acidimicrobiaceae bacterium]|nr:Gfo/Idh/MocA family oxidoreductase [Acidimicrobiaceae bacterium]
MAGREHGFAIVGCGVIGPSHARAIQALPNAHLVAAVDVVEEKARELTDKFGGDPETDLDRVLGRPDVDVVCVCVPSGLHAEVGCRAAEAGKHVLVEKPIDITLEAADRLIATARRSGVRLSVVSQYRFAPDIRRVRELIDGGRLGRPVLGDAIVKWYRTQGYYDSGDWRGTWALDGGGCLMNQGIHYIDLLQWLMGPVKTVTAQTATLGHTVEVEDVALAMVQFESGAVGVIEGSTAIYPGLPERLEISGQTGTVIVESARLVLCELQDEKGEVGSYGAKGRSREQQSATSTSADPAALSLSSHLPQIAELLDAIESDRDPFITGEAGRRPLEIILAIYESARQGRPVQLPLT